jgi:hypothetical protein
LQQQLAEQRQAMGQMEAAKRAALDRAAAAYEEALD